MQLELHVPPPEPEEPEEVPVPHLVVIKPEQQKDYLTVKHITNIVFELVYKLEKKHPLLKLLNRKQIQKMNYLIMLKKIQLIPVKIHRQVLV